MRGKHIGLMVLDAVFLGVIFLASRMGKVVDPLSLIVLSLATFRLARAVSFNEIFEWLREPFCEVKNDSCGAGANAHPRKNHQVIGGLLSCPICTGTWSALALFILYYFVPVFGTYLAYVLAIAGVSELLHYFGESMEWKARHARVIAGAISPDETD